MAGAIRVPWSLVIHGRDKRIYWAWLIGLLALVAFGVGLFTLNVLLLGGSVILAAIAVLLFRQGWRRVWR